MEGVTVREIVGPAFGLAVNQSLVHAVLDPDAQTIEHLHRSSEEVLWILSGTGWVRIDGEHRAAAAGDCIVISPGARHKLFNRGPERLVLLACCAPAYSPDDTVPTECAGAPTPPA